jgi:hypothetical protein
VQFEADSHHGSVRQLVVDEMINDTYRDGDVQIAELLIYLM